MTRDEGTEPRQILVAGLGGQGVLFATNILLRAALDLEDIGLFLAPGPSSLSVESREYVLRPAVATAVEATAAALGAPAARVQTYLANEIRVRGRIFIE